MQNHTRGCFIMALPTRVQRGAGQGDAFESVQREFDTMLNRWFGGREPNGGAACYLATDGVDGREDHANIDGEAEPPGCRKDEIDVTLQNQTLTISAERRSEQKQGDQKKGDLLLHERRYSRFLRSFTLPPTVDEQTV